MARPLMLPGSRSLVPITAEQIDRVKRAVELLKSLNPPVYSLGQIDDQRVGMKPLPKKPEPKREIPEFPSHTYNFLKRPV